jgi:hypothetical protein
MLTAVPFDKAADQFQPIKRLRGLLHASLIPTVSKSRPSRPVGLMVVRPRADIQPRLASCWPPNVLSFDLPQRKVTLTDSRSIEKTTASAGEKHE